MSTRANDLDASLIRTNRLELVERISDDIAHEIKNPLHSMVINLEVLKRRVSRTAEPGAGELMRYVEVLAAELERVNHRIEVLLRLLRPARHGNRVSLDDLLDDCRQLIDLEGARRGIHLEVESLGFADPVYLTRDVALQLLLSLLLDALDAAAPGDGMGLRAEPADGGVRLVLEVTPVAERAQNAGRNGISTEPPGRAVPPPLEGLERLCAAVGGSLDVMPRESGFTCVLSLPLAA